MKESLNQEKDSLPCLGVISQQRDPVGFGELGIVQSNQIHLIRFYSLLLLMPRQTWWRNPGMLRIGMSPECHPYVSLHVFP